MIRKTKKKREESQINPSENGRAAEVATVNESAEEAFGKLLQLVRTVQSGMQNIAGNQGLSGSQVWALWQISAQPGLRVTELASAQHIHPSTASNLLDKLEARALVRRDRHDTDSRVVRLYLTDAGINLAKSVPGPMQGQLRRALRAVPKPILDDLLRGVTALLDLMGEPPPKPKPTNHP